MAWIIAIGGQKPGSQVGERKLGSLVDLDLYPGRTHI